MSTLSDQEASPTATKTAKQTREPAVHPQTSRTSRRRMDASLLNDYITKKDERVKVFGRIEPEHMLEFLEKVTKHEGYVANFSEEERITLESKLATFKDREELWEKIESIQEVIRKLTKEPKFNSEKLNNEISVLKSSLQAVQGDLKTYAAESHHTRITDVECSDTRRRPGNLPDNTPKFSGRGEDDVEIWIDKIEIFMDAARVEHAERLIQAARFLDGTAWFDYTRYKRVTEIPSWHDFKEFLSKQYKTDNKKMFWRRKMLSIKQGSKRIAEYNDEFSLHTR